MNRLTIFTATYNRAYILPRLYETLISQSNKEFEWLIVDDGSIDNTRELVEKWIKEGLVNIKYIYQPNGGKMRAHNNGVLHTTSELFFCVDSDDYLVNNEVVGDIFNKWDAEEKSDKIAGIIALRSSSNTDNYNLIGKTTTLTYLYSHGFKGDTALIFKTEILRKFLFPEIEGEKFVTESYIYNQLDCVYEMLFFKKGLTSGEYLPDGYTHTFNKVYISNPKGWALFFNQSTRLKKSKVLKLKFLLKYICVCFFIADKTNTQVIRESSFPIFTILFFPLGYLFYLRKKAQLKKAGLIK